MSVLWGVESEALPIAIYHAVFSNLQASTAKINGSKLLEKHSSLHPAALIEIIDYMQLINAIDVNLGKTTIREMASTREYSQLIENIEIKPRIKIHPGAVTRAIRNLRFHDSNARKAMCYFVLFHCFQHLLNKACERYSYQFSPMFSRDGIINHLPTGTTLIDLNEVIERQLSRTAISVNSKKMNIEIATERAIPFLQYYIGSGDGVRPISDLINTCPLIKLVLVDLCGFDQPIERERWGGEI